jgi:formaldehyde-activating enzyme involved in methanogenesis
MEILVIDGQGGGLGRQLVAAVKKAVPQAVVTAIGTNSAATSAMLKAGADRAATGENAVVVGCRRVVNCRTADIIVGPIGIVMADALLGEITPAMAQAVAQSDARRILIPANRCDTLVVGVSAPIGTLVEQAAAAVLDGCRN